MQHRWLAPVKAVAEIQCKRPVVVQLRTRLGLDGRAGFGFTMDASSEAIGALAFQRTMDRHRTIDAIAAAIQRDSRRSLSIAVNVAIGVDPKEKHAPMHTAH